MLKRGTQVEVVIRGHVEQDGDDFIVISSHAEPLAHHLTTISKLEIRQGMGEIKDVGPIKLGEDVLDTAGYHGTVIFTDEGTAFIRVPPQNGAPNGFHAVRPISTLRRK